MSFSLGGFVKNITKTVIAGPMGLSANLIGGSGMGLFAPGSDFSNLVSKGVNAAQPTPTIPKSKPLPLFGGALATTPSGLLDTTGDYYGQRKKLLGGTQ